METRSLVCANIEETFLSRKNNIHRARARAVPLCARFICISRVTFRYCNAQAAFPRQVLSCSFQTMIHIANLDDSLNFPSPLLVLSSYLTAVTSWAEVHRECLFPTVLFIRLNLPRRYKSRSTSTSFPGKFVPRKECGCTRECVTRLACAA